MTLLLAALAASSALAAERADFKTPDKVAVAPAQAQAILKTWLDGQSFYPFPDKCLELKPQGMKAGGHLFEVRKKYCAGITMPGPLDLWRVDANTGRLTIRDPDGKFKPPPPKPTDSQDDEGAGGGPTFHEVEQLLVFNGFGYSLAAAEELLARYGARLVPALDTLLTNVRYYEDNPMRTGSFPYNAVWLLGRIGSNQAKAMLERYRKHANNVAADYALAGIELRRETKDRDCVVLSKRYTLFDAPSYLGKPLAELEAGQKVRLIVPRQTNYEESGLQGGPAVFDFIELLPSLERGYIERVGPGDAIYF
jgi:hypothetical protein